jgi:hypothetical protein
MLTNFLNYQLQNYSPPSPPKDFSLFGNPSVDEYLSLKRSLHEKLLSEIEERTDKVSWWELYNLDKVYFSLDRLDNRFEQLCNKIYLKCSLVFNDDTFLDRLNYESSLTDPWVYDLHINYVGVEYDLEIWNIWKSLCEECPYLIAFEDCAIIIDRPIELYLDAELMTHAEGKAAIKFSDGYICTYHQSIRAVPLETEKLEYEAFLNKVQSDST